MRILLKKQKVFFFYFFILILLFVYFLFPIGRNKTSFKEGVDSPRNLQLPTAHQASGKYREFKERPNPVKNLNTNSIQYDERSVGQQHENSRKAEKKLRGN